MLVGALELTPVGGYAAAGAAWAFVIYLLALLVPMPFWILQFPYPPGMFFVHVGVGAALSAVAHRFWQGRKARPRSPPPASG